MKEFVYLPMIAINDNGRIVGSPVSSETFKTYKAAEKWLKEAVENRTDKYVNMFLDGGYSEWAEVHNGQPVSYGFCVLAEYPYRYQVKIGNHIESYWGHEFSYGEAGRAEAEAFANRVAREFGGIVEEIRYLP